MAFRSKLIELIFRVFRSIVSLKRRPTKVLVILFNWIRQCLSIDRGKSRRPPPPKGISGPPSQQVLCPSSAPRAGHVKQEILQGRGDDCDGLYTAPTYAPHSASNSFLGAGRLHADSHVLRADRLPAEPRSSGAMSIEEADAGTRSIRGRPLATRAPSTSTSAIPLLPISRQSPNNIPVGSATPVQQTYASTYPFQHTSRNSTKSQEPEKLFKDPFPNRPSTPPPSLSSNPATGDSPYGPMAPATVQRWHRRVNV